MDELRRRTIDNVRLLSRWSREQTERLDALNSKPAPELCEHCGMTAEVCRCYDEVAA